MFFNRDFSQWYKTAIFLLMAILMINFVGKALDIALMFFGAFIISSSVLPAVNKLKKYMPRALAVFLVLILLLLGVLLVFIPLTMLTINQIAAFISDAPKYFDIFQNFLNKAMPDYDLSHFIQENGIQNLSETITTAAGNILSSGLTAGKIIAGSITSILMVAIMVFYLCMDEAHITSAYLSFFPPKFKKKAEKILNTMKSKIGGYVFAQLLTMGFVGLITFIGLFIAHHPHPTIIGFLTFILDFVPVVGPLIAILIGTITAYSGGASLMLAAFCIMVFAQWAENHLARPYLFGKFMDIHPLLIIVSLLIGAKFLGLAGVILAPAFASLVCILVDELYIKQINSEK